MASDENSFFGLKVPEGNDRRELYKSQYRAIYTYTMSAPETLWDANADGFEAGIKSFKLVVPNKKKFREPGNEGLLPPLPF